MNTIDRPPCLAPRSGRHLAALTALAACLFSTACSRSPARLAGSGDPAAGAVAITRQACGSCHRIPGIEGAGGVVGPPLTQFRQRQMIVGIFPNTPADLRRYLKNPAIAGAGNFMPDQGLTDRQVADITAYLYTLR